MVAVKVGVVRQYSAIAITVNPDIICIFIKKIRKCSMYIVLIDFS